MFQNVETGQDGGVDSTGWIVVNRWVSEKTNLILIVWVRDFEQRNSLWCLLGGTASICRMNAGVEGSVPFFFSNWTLYYIICLMEQTNNWNLANVSGDTNSGPSVILSSDTSGRVTVAAFPLKSYSALWNSTRQLSKIMFVSFLLYLGHGNVK